MLVNACLGSNESANDCWAKLKNSQLICFHTSFTYSVSVSDEIYLKIDILFEWKPAWIAFFHWL